jgi:MarR family transcriptional regulator, organic hydroperoxide resistance regulator
LYTKYIHTNIPQAKETEEGVTSMEEVSKAVKVVQLMKKVMSTIKHRMGNHFKEMNLTGPQGMLMGTLAHHGEMKVSDLSEKLRLSNSTVSGILDRLENQGLVERTRSKEDRRVVYIKVTDEFRKHSQKHFEEINKLIESMMDKATPEELDIILEGMNTLEKVIDRQKE